MKMLVNSLSGGLVETRQYESGTIFQVCHQPVNDFLLSDGLQLMLPSSMGPSLSTEYVIGMSQDRLVRRCINYLSLGNPKEDRTWSKESVYELPFIEYEVKCWFLHAEKAEANGSSQEALIEVFSTKPGLFQTWVKRLQSHPGIPKQATRIRININTHRISVKSPNRSQSAARQRHFRRNRNRFQSRSLHYAARWGYAELAVMLPDANADREAKDDFGGTPLERAAANQPEDVVKILLNRGADVNERMGYSGTSLQSACMNGSISVVQMLIDNGAEINAPGRIFGNALQIAAYEENKAVVRLLLDCGAVETMEVFSQQLHRRGMSKLRICYSLQEPISTWKEVSLETLSRLLRLDAMKKWSSFCWTRGRVLTAREVCTDLP